MKNSILTLSTELYSQILEYVHVGSVSDRVDRDALMTLVQTVDRSEFSISNKETTIFVDEFSKWIFSIIYKN